MQTQNINGLSFNGIHSQFTKMNRAQRKLTNILVDGVSYSNEYIKACDKNIDICFFPNPKNKSGVIAKFLKRDSETFVKDLYGKKSLVRAFTLSGGIDKLIKTLKDVVSDIYPIADVVDEVYEDTNTDMCKLYKELEYPEIDDPKDIADFYKNNKKFD